MVKEGKLENSKNSHVLFSNRERNFDVFGSTQLLGVGIEINCSQIIVCLVMDSVNRRCFLDSYDG